MIRDEATQRQVDAADPANSTWLSANAGSGKTRVLTDRVARLLFQGVSPQNILCLTYTKAAAAEMQNRLFRRLGSWAMQDDDALRAELRALGADETLNATRLNAARTLFASAIETPGGLKIQTIHAFCAGILRRFPLEAGVSPQFQEMEDRAADLLRQEVVDTISAGPEAARVAELMTHFTGAEFADLLAGITRHRNRFARATDEAEISHVLGISPDLTEAEAIRAVLSPTHRDLADRVAAAFSAATKSYQKDAARLQALTFDNPTRADFDALCGLFLYAADGTSKSVNYPQSRHTSAVAAIAPVADELHAWMDATETARDGLMALAMRDRTLALHRFARPFVQLYQTRKDAQGLLDFDDLIDKAAALLGDPRVADWVLYRLDGGIDHVLVDEAQDTSPAQWTVIRHLTRELTAGEGARSDTPRTLFVVGDKKQSIYSFQGADPAEFDRMRADYERQLAAPGPGLHSRELAHSFRSAPAILRVVDATFADPERSRAIGRDGFHEAFQNEMPGRVDLWPPIDPVGAPDDDDRWDDPVDRVRDTHHDVLMAERIAQQITRMIGEETLPRNTATGVQRRPVTPGDILILVQRRGTLFAEIIRACKAAGLPVAGADRFKVGAVLAVRDIGALLSFLALPEDDLSLAAALRSPLFGWSERDLFQLAHHRPEKSFLWEALRRSQSHPQTLAVLDDLIRNADFLRPYDLIDRLLIRHDGRRNLLARLGAEAEDGIDALLSQALAYESMGVPSLTGFLSWMETDTLEVKRQMDSQGDQIRVMSVHGAKGLEAPIVILPDSAKRRNDLRDEILLADDLPLWKSVKDDDPAALRSLRAAALARQEDERLRLLYVAMTRAEQWLIVGAAGELGKPGESWHSLVDAGLVHAGPVLTDAGGLAVQRVENGDWSAGEVAVPDAPDRPDVAVPVFGPPPAIAISGTLSPSDLGGAKVLPQEAAPDDAEASLIRGRLLHLLLEHLPTVPEGDRTSYARRLIAASPDAVETETGQQVIHEAEALLRRPELAPIFGPGSRAEVGITANLPTLGGARIHGAIDRLLITPERILAVDFKSNRIVPDRAEETPQGLLRQMGAYAEALRVIHPHTPVETAILWTSTAVLMPMPAQLIAEALAGVTTS